jgi:hypothetical protein
MKMLQERASKYLLEKSAIELGSVRIAPTQACYCYWNLERKLGAAAAPRARENADFAG